jgi:hypothetical protein
MKREQEIPYYASDGTPLGFRSAENAKRLVDGGFVEPSYGRKGHLKAIWSRRQDGSNPVDAHAPTGTKYSFTERLDSGHHCWKHRRLDRRDDDGTLVSTQGSFLQVITDCTVP